MLRGRNARASPINHLVLRHGIAREEGRGIADGKLVPTLGYGKLRAKCPVDGCDAMLTIHKGTLYGHLPSMHPMEVRECSLMITEWMERHTPKDRDTGAEDMSIELEPVTDPEIDADIIPPSEVECEGCDQLRDGECADDEGCVCDCDRKMEQLHAVAGEHHNDTVECTRRGQLIDRGELVVGIRV